MDMGGTLQELSRSPAIPCTQEDITTTMEDIRTMEEVRTPVVALRMEMGMEEATIRTVPTSRHQSRGIRVTLPISSARRLDIIPMNV